MEQKVLVGTGKIADEVIDGLLAQYQGWEIQSANTSITTLMDKYLNATHLYCVTIVIRKQRLAVAA